MVGNMLKRLDDSAERRVEGRHNGSPKASVVDETLRAGAEDRCELGNDFADVRSLAARSDDGAGKGGDLWAPHHFIVTISNFGDRDARKNLAPRP